MRRSTKSSAAAPALLTLGLAFAVASPAFAGVEDDLSDLGDLDIDAIFLEDEFALLAEEDFVISAVRHAQRIEHSPSAITVISREKILASGYDNLPDLMRLVPGADVLRVSQIHAGVGLRTGSSPGGDLIRVLLDGRDMGTHLLGTPLWMAMPVDPDAIERIEVIRGPGSTLYGSQAIQGVVNIVTRRPADVPIVVEGRASAAGPETHQIDLRAHGTVGEFGYWVSGGHDMRGPQDDLFGDPAQVWRGRARLDWHPADDREGRLEIGFVTGAGDTITAVGRGRLSAMWPYLLARYAIGNTELQLVAEETRALLDIDFALVVPPTEEREAIPLGRVPAIRHDTRSAELWAQHALEPLAGHRLTFGASARVIHHLPGTMVTCPATERRDFDPDECEPVEIVESRLGAYVQDEWQLRDDLTLTGGLRIDRSSLNPDTGISPRLAAVWSPHAQHALRFSIGRAYRFPLFLESHGHVLMEADPDAPPDLVRAAQYLFAVGGGNPALDNQTVDSVEAGWRGRFLDGKLVTTVDLFALVHRNRFRLDGLDDIELVPGFGGVPTIPEDVLPLYDNRPDPLLALGGEAAAAWRATPWMELSGSYALDQRILDEDGLAFHHADVFEPRHRLIATSRFDLVHGLGAGLDVHWSSTFLSRSQDPVSILLEPLSDTLGGEPIVLGSLRYRRPVGERTFEVGLFAYNLLGRPMQEQAGAEQLARRLRLHVSLRP